MHIKIIYNNLEKKSYNDFVYHPMQSWQWGKARQVMGIEVLRITDNKDNFQLTIHPIPHTPWKIGYLPRSVIPTKEIIEYLKEYGKKNKLIFIKIEPYEEKSKVKSQKLKVQVKNKKLVKSSNPLFPDWTQVLDITQSEEDLLKNLKPKTRYNIRLAQKKGVVVKEENNDKGFQIFNDLYFATCKRQKYYGHTTNYHQIVWNNIKNSISHILIAYYQNQPLVVYQLWYFKDKFYYVYGGSSEQHRNLMAANLLMWEAIKLGKRLGAKTFDMWGSLPPEYDQSHPWAGFTRFKESYGTKFTELVGSYDLVINPFLYRLYNFGYYLRNIYLFFKRLF